MAPPVRIAALGGLGEVGMNCLALECDGRIAVVDCGILFPNEPLGIDVIAPDLTWLRERRDRIDAVFLTHGHEDHIGALPWLLRDLRVPVYGTRFTLALLRSRLEEAGVEALLLEVKPGDVRPAGDSSPISVEFLAVTHSIPDACALAFRTPQGTLLHTGDFKIDEHPVAGPPIDLDRIAALGDSGVRCLLSDSTNSERPGRSLPESQVAPALEAAFEKATGRVLVACFASNIFRVKQVAHVARGFGRRVALLGRAMEQNVRLALDMGYLDFPPWQLASPEEAHQLPPREICMLTTGTQGEPRSALSRLARGDHPDVRIEKGDLVILSSRHIPGNEIAVGRLVDAICRLGAEVAYEGAMPLHVSGHAHEDEQRRILSLARPRHFVPVHGEYRHLSRHARLAISEGVAKDRCHILTDGEVLELSDEGARVLEERIPTGRVYTDRNPSGGGEVGELVVKDRRLLAEAGLCIAVMAVDRSTGSLVRAPDLFAKGVAGFDELESEIRSEVIRSIDALPSSAKGDLEELQETLRLAVRRCFRRGGARRPSVLPIVLEL